MAYIVTRHDQILYGENIANNTNHFSHYIASARIASPAFAKYMPVQVQKLYEFYGKETDFVLSAEEFYHRYDAFPNFVKECKKHNPDLKVEVLFIVRPQVEWINSGYFQWFAFEDGDFRDISQLPLRNWYQYIKLWANADFVDTLIVKPLYKNIMNDFYEWLGLEYAQETTKNNNQSLGENLAKFIIHNQKALGRTVHVPNIDFMFEQFLSKDPEINGKKAFTLTKEQVTHILDVHRKDNKKMLQYFDPKDREQILNNPKWWDVAAYENMFSNPYNPTLELDNVNLIAVELTKLAQQLIVQKTQQQRSNTGLQQQLKTKQETVQTLQQQLKTKQETVQTLQQQLKTKQEIVQDFQQQMVVKQKNLEELEQSLNHVQKSLENKQKAHHQEQAAKQNLEHKIQTSKKLSRINLLKALFSKRYRKSFIQYP